MFYLLLTEDIKIKLKILTQGHRAGKTDIQEKDQRKCIYFFHSEYLIKFESVSPKNMKIESLFWQLAPDQSLEEGIAFELENVEKISPFSKEIDPQFYMILLKGCVVQTEIDLLPALLRGAIELEEYEIAAYIKRRIEKINKEYKQELN